MMRVRWLSCALAISVSVLLVAQDKEPNPPANFTALFAVGDHLYLKGNESSFTFELLTDQRLAEAKELYGQRAQAAAELREVEEQMRGTIQFNRDPANRDQRGNLMRRRSELLRIARSATINVIKTIGVDYVHIQALGGQTEQFIHMSRIARVIRGGTDEDRDERASPANDPAR